MRVTTCTLLAVLATGAGCGRAHLSADFGRANREAYTMQQATSAKARGEPSMALDTQEAAAISSGYLKSLAGKGEGGEPAPVVLVAPPRAGQPQSLAPSVPRSQ